MSEKELEFKKKRTKLIFSLFILWIAVYLWNKIQANTSLPDIIYYINILLITILLILWNLKK